MKIYIYCTSPLLWQLFKNVFYEIHLICTSSECFLWLKGLFIMILLHLGDREKRKTKMLYALVILILSVSQPTIYLVRAYILISLSMIFIFFDCNFVILSRNTSFNRALDLILGGLGCCIVDSQLLAQVGLHFKTFRQSDQTSLWQARLGLALSAGEGQG